MSGYGLSGWGIEAYGGTSLLSVQGAVALTTHSVLVTLSTEPLNRSPLRTGDALNPRTWSIKRADDTQTWTVLASRRVSDRRFQLYVLQPLGDWKVSHAVRSDTLLAAAGFRVSSPYRALFRGVETGGRTGVVPDGPFDLASADLIGGGLQTGVTGGYNRVYADDLIRKMVLRRLTTMPGAYFHLAPEDFGADLKAKEAVRTSGLPALKMRLEGEIAKEPGVLSVTVGLTSGSGFLAIRAKIRTASGHVEVNVNAR